MGTKGLGRDTCSHNGPNSLILAGESAQATHQPIRRVLVWEKNDLFNLRQPLCAAETTLQSTSLNKAKGEGPQFLDSHRKPSRTCLESVELVTHGEHGGPYTAQHEALCPHLPAHRPNELTWPACLVWGRTDRMPLGSRTRAQAWTHQALEMPKLCPSPLIFLHPTPASPHLFPSASITSPSSLPLH